MSEDYAPLSTLVEEIKRLCRQNAAGTLFISTIENHSAQIILKDGQITAALYSRMQGEEAVKKISESRGVRFRFRSGSVSLRTEMPPTNTVLYLLSQGKRPPSPPPSSQSHFTSDEKEVIIKEFTIYIGPIAEVIASSHLTLSTDAGDAIRRLASEIPSQEQAEKFAYSAAAKIEELRAQR